jgi:hypothetical protein
MDFLFLVPIIGLLFIYAVERERNFAYRQRLAELDLFKRRFVAYEQLKSAVERLRTSGAVCNTDIGRFAQAMSDMRFLFDEDLEHFVSDIYDALRKKHALDVLLEKADGRANALTDQVLMDKALRKSRQLATQISNGIYREMPKHLEPFMRPRPFPPPLSQALTSHHSARKISSRTMSPSG